MPTEPEWNEAIFDWFFGERAIGRPVYLSLDDEVLLEIALEREWDLPDAVSDFEAAQRTYVAPAGGRPFRIRAEAADRWRRRPLEERGMPPFVALLGATVLAAARESDWPSPGGRRGYYDRVRDLFGLGGAGTITGYYPDVPNMWNWLNEWLGATGGAHGLPTACAPEGYFPYIGYSLSQAVFLSNDRSRLFDFFEAIGVEPRSEFEPDELLARFRRWVAGPGRATPRVKKALDDPEKVEVIGEILAIELRYWDGTIRDARGLRVLRVLPHIDAYRNQLNSVTFIPAGLGERVVHIDGKDVELPEGPRFIRVPTLCRLSLSDPKSWIAGDLRFREDVDPVMVLRPDDDVGGWVPVRRAEYGESHYVLVHTSALNEVTEFLEQHVPGPAREVSKIPLPQGWHLFRDVVLSTTTIALAPELRPLLALADEMPQLVGGLCVDPMRSLYLDNAAPDVLVPQFEQELAVILDGTLMKSVQGTGDLIPLADRKLSVGAHEVRVGSSLLRFSLVAARVVWPQEAQLAHNLHRMDWGFVPDRELGPPRADADADVAVSGAAILTARPDPELSPDPPTMVRVSAKGYLALGSCGFSAEVDVEQPSWAKRNGLLFNAFEVAAIERQAGFSVLWVGRRFATRTDLVRVGRPSAQEASARPDVVAWESAIKQLLSGVLVVQESARPAWDAYCEGLGTDA